MISDLLQDPLEQDLQLKFFLREKPQATRCVFYFSIPCHFILKMGYLWAPFNEGSWTLELPSRLSLSSLTLRSGATNTPFLHGRRQLYKRACKSRFGVGEDWWRRCQNYVQRTLIVQIFYDTEKPSGISEISMSFKTHFFLHLPKMNFCSLTHQQADPWLSSREPRHFWIWLLTLFTLNCESDSFFECKKTTKKSTCE